MRIKTKIMQTRPADVARDAWREIQRGAMTAAGEHWLKEMLPNHFTPQAKYTYKHKPRNNKYNENKKRLAARGQAIMGGLVDNVLTGKFRESLLKRAVIRGFPTRCTIYMFGPFYTNIKFNRSAFRRDGSSNSPSQQPNKPEEIKTVTHLELAVLKKIVRSYVIERLQKYRGSRKTETV